MFCLFIQRPTEVGEDTEADGEDTAEAGEDTTTDGDAVSDQSEGRIREIVGINERFVCFLHSLRRMGRIWWRIRWILPSFLRRMVVNGDWSPFIHSSTATGIRPNEFLPIKRLSLREFYLSFLGIGGVMQYRIFT